MSHYTYHKKYMVEIEDGRVLPLALYSDSSVTIGRGRYERHPVSACVLNLGNHGLLVDKEEWKGLLQQELDRQFELLTAFEEKYGSGRKVTLDSTNYGGNVYPGGRKLKNLRAFFSVRRTISIEEFLRRTGGCSVYFYALKPKSWDAYEGSKVDVFLRDNDSFVEAENKYQEIRRKFPSDNHMVVGLTGLI